MPNAYVVRGSYLS